MLDLERSRVAFEKGQIGPGMLWTVESLRMATEAGDEAGKHLAPGQPVGVGARIRRARPVSFPRRAGTSGRVQPGRQDDPNRISRPHRAALGCGNGPTHRPASSAFGQCDVGGVQPGRHALRHRGLRQDGTGMGPRRRQACR